jgi:hypothetical protein
MAQPIANSEEIASAISAPAPRPVCSDSRSCTSPSARRSGSLSAMIEACASRADTRPCRLPRMAPACERVCSYSFSSASRRSRVCSSLVAARRSSGLPSSMPWAISLNEFRSLPSRNTASGDTPSMVRNSLADLPIRWVSITSWPAAEISDGAAFCCSLSEETVSAISSRSDDWRLMVRSAAPTCVRIFCWPITVLAFFSARSISGTIFSMSDCSCGETGARRSVSSPDRSARTVCASTVALSCTSGKACGLPIRACDTDLARRCDCISEEPVPATCWATLSAWFTAKMATEPSTTSAKDSRVNRTRWWVAVVRRPSSGTLISSASSTSSPSSSPMVSGSLGACVLPASIDAVEGSGAPRLSSWVTDGSISSGCLLANRFFREKADMVLPSKV